MTRREPAVDAAAPAPARADTGVTNKRPNPRVFDDSTDSSPGDADQHQTPDVAVADGASSPGRFRFDPARPPIAGRELAATASIPGRAVRGTTPAVATHNPSTATTGPVSNGMLPANMVFRTGAPDQLNRMVITSEGLVGIGTMNPQFNLHTVGNTHTTGDFFGRIHMDENGGNPGPDTYTEEAYLEYKSGAALSAPDVSRGGLLTLAPSANQAGERDHQLFFNDGGIFHRWGDAPANTWAGMWHKLLTGEDIHGTENRLAKFTGPNSLGDSRLFDDGSRVGINNFAPAYDLDVTGTTRITGNAYVSGNVGIGTTTPGVKLDVNGETVWICCAGCEDTVRSDPEKYVAKVKPE